MCVWLCRADGDANVDVDVGSDAAAGSERATINFVFRLHFHAILKFTLPLQQASSVVLVVVVVAVARFYLFAICRGAL